MAKLLTTEQVAQELTTRLPSWHRAGNEIQRSIESETFPAAIQLVDSVATEAERRNHHPDIDIRWTTVTFRLSTHSDGGITDADLELAGEIDSLAERATQH